MCVPMREVARRTLHCACRVGSAAHTDTPLATRRRIKVMMEGLKKKAVKQQMAYAGDVALSGTCMLNYVDVKRRDDTEQLCRRELMKKTPLNQSALQRSVLGVWSPAFNVV